MKTVLLSSFEAKFSMKNTPVDRSFTHLYYFSPLMQNGLRFEASKQILPVFSK
jgi:hypothetical protein